MGLLTDQAQLIKKGKYLNIDVIADPAGLSITDEFKTTIHQAIGNKNFYQFIGRGDQKISLSIFLKDTDAYNAFVSFFEDGEPFVLSLKDIRSPFRLDGSIKSTKSYADNSFIAEFSVTSALDPDDDTLGLDADGLGGIAETISKKKTALDSIKSWAESTIDFVGNTNVAVGAYTGKFQDYATAINQLTAGIAASSSIITTPISSVRNSASSIIGGVSGVVSALGSAIQAIKELPSQVGDMIDSVLDIGDQFSNIFNFGNKQNQLKTSTEFLIDIGSNLVAVSDTPPSIKITEEDPYTVTYDPQFFVASETSKNLQVLSVLMISSILLSIYEQASQVTRYNTDDLDRVMAQTEALFSFLMLKEINGSVRVNLIAARNSFFRVYRGLYNAANKIITINLDSPRLLMDVVYSVNGNFDYYSDTKKLNNIVGSIVQGQIRVISND